MNRIIIIDALNDEMTLEADTKLVENALESKKVETTCQENGRAHI